MIKEKKILLVIFIAGIALLFYWFQWRPNEIRKSCANEATNKYKGYGNIVNNYYRLCLVKHGMKPESLFVGN